MDKQTAYMLGKVFKLGMIYAQGKAHKDRKLALDEAKWITVHPNGKENKGRPALLDSETGEVLGGMGGKFNGKHISAVPEHGKNEQMGAQMFVNAKNHKADLMNGQNINFRPKQTNTSNELLSEEARSLVIAKNHPELNEKIKEARKLILEQGISAGSLGVNRMPLNGLNKVEDRLAEITDSNGKALRGYTKEVEKLKRQREEFLNNIQENFEIFDERKKEFIKNNQPAENTTKVNSFRDRLENRVNDLENAQKSINQSNLNKLRDLAKQSDVSKSIAERRKEKIKVDNDKANNIIKGLNDKSKNLADQYRSYFRENTKDGGIPASWTKEDYLNRRNEFNSAIQDLENTQKQIKNEYAKIENQNARKKLRELAQKTEQDKRYLQGYVNTFNEKLNQGEIKNTTNTRTQNKTLSANKDNGSVASVLNVPDASKWNNKIYKYRNGERAVFINNQKIVLNDEQYNKLKDLAGK